MVKIVLNNLTSKIVGYIPEEVHAQLDKALSYRVLNARFSPKVKAKQWDGIIRLYRKNYGQSFYSGLLSFVGEILEENKIPYQKVDERIKPTQNLPHLVFSPPSNYEEREYQQFTIQRALQRSRGILKIATGGGKCLGLGTPILMFDGSIKSVENIVIGDEIMGPDSTPRKVLSTCKGYGPLYRVEQNNGQDFICNDAHILCLQRTTCPSKKWDEKNEIEISASDFHNGNKWIKHTYKGFKVGVEFGHKDVSLDPYWLGLWLGDGNKKDPAITTGDKEIVSFIKSFAKKHKLSLRESKGQGCSTYYFVQNKNHKNNSVGLLKNTILDTLREFSLLDNKHIPNAYKYNDRTIRLALLAGLIDSDGSAKRKGSVEFYNKSLKLIDDVCYLARSLGFRVHMGRKKDQIKSIGYSGTSYRLVISGNISEIPIKIKRKQTGDKTKYSALRYGISLTPIGEGIYYGFEIDKDGRFLLGDFTVTHNTMVVAETIAAIKTAPFMFYVLTTDLLRQAHDTLSTTLNEPIGMIGGGRCDIRNINVCTIQTAIQAIYDGAKIKVSDYQFDDEDSWDEDDMLTAENRQKIRNLIFSLKGLYFDETHHAAAKTCKEVLSASPNAYWRFGGSATPYREDGAEILIQAMFGKKIVDVSASYLIDKGYLVQPSIIFEPIEQDCTYHAWKTVYKHCIIDNQDFNRHVAATANYLVSKGLSVLVLVTQYAQGDFLKTLIPDAPFLTGKKTDKQRDKAISELRSGKNMCMIATTLADEGLDIPTLDAVLMAGGGASATRVNQRIGRALRRDKKSSKIKKKALAIYYNHKGVRHLGDHAKKVKRILKIEPRFEVLESAGESFLFSEIDQIMGWDTKPYGTLFDL